jgi:hypothetical protein
MCVCEVQKCVLAGIGSGKISSNSEKLMNACGYIGVTGKDEGWRVVLRGWCSRPGPQSKHSINKKRFLRSTNFEVFCQIKDKSINCCVLRRFPKIAKSDYYLRHVCLSVCLSACNNSAPTGRILMKSDILVFIENLSRKSKCH